MLLITTNQANGLKNVRRCMDAEEGFKGGALAEEDHLEKNCNKDFKERGK